MLKRTLLAAIAAATLVFPSVSSAVAWKPPPCKPPAKCPIEKPPPD